MDLQALSLPDWLPWWGVMALLVPVALYLALFLLMPFSTFGLRGRLHELEMRLDALHEELRGLTLRLPDRGGLNLYDNLPPIDQPPIPPIPPKPRETGGRERGGFGDPVADKMLAYMREKAQSDVQRADVQRADQPRPAARPRAEPRFTPAPRESGPRDPGFREPSPRAFELPPPPRVGPPAGMSEPLPDYDFPPDAASPPRPPRVPGRFGRRGPDGDGL